MRWLACSTVLASHSHAHQQGFVVCTLLAHSWQGEAAALWSIEDLISSLCALHCIRLVGDSHSGENQDSGPG